MVKDDSKKNLTFIAFFKVLLGRVKAEIMLIYGMVSWLFLYTLQSPGWGLASPPAPPPLCVSFQQQSQMVKDESKKNPTFVVFLKLLLGRVKEEIMLI